MMPTLVGKMSPRRRLYIAGMSIRFVRSPLAPKKTMLHGSAIRLESSPARKGLAAPFFSVRMSEPSCTDIRYLYALTAGSASCFTACPPNWLRSAAMTLALNDSS